ncbi:unnamed protein product, partial [Effrenium voratum]
RAAAGEGAVYLVRHGQSTWNLAAKRWDLWTMFSQVDHPLTAEGLKQAQDLRVRMREAKFLSDGTRVFSSPLARAVATTIAAVGLDRSIELLPAAREIAWPWCGPDSMGTHGKAALMVKVLQSLQDDTLQDQALDLVDASRLAGKWSGRESKQEMHARLRLLLSLVRPAVRPSRARDAADGRHWQNSVLVCHSLLIQRLFKDFASEALQKESPELLLRLRARKLQNCGAPAIRSASPPLGAWQWGLDGWVNPGT